MRGWSSRWAGLIVGGILIFGVTAIDAANNHEIEEARQTFIKDMKRPDPYSRSLAVKNLAKVIKPAAAELLIKRGFTDEDPSVRKTARQVLRQLAIDPAVNQYLFSELEKTIRKPTGFQLSCEYVRALTVPDDPALQDKLVRYLNDYLAAPKANPVIPMSAIDDFALQGNEDAVQAVKLLAKVKLFESHFGYRRCVVQAMTQLLQPTAVDFLIEMLPHTEGLIQYDIVFHLTRLTRQKFRSDALKWTEWWEENRKSFQFPTQEDLLAVDMDDFDEDQLTYYRIPICAKRVVFVLDTSNSMRGHPIDAAKQALIYVVQSLPEAVSFDIVLFDGQATTWRPQLSNATPDAKRAATALVINRELGGGTSSSDALKAAFKLEPEAIYFISDGKPTDFPPDQIVFGVSQVNRLHRISIHGVGLVTGNRGGAELREFMQPLARQNWGTFRLIE